MNEKRYAGKVGVFVALGLALLMALLMSFGKGLSMFTQAFKLSLRAQSVGGLKNNANVLLSGVPVGRVTGFDVAPDGKGVLIFLSIEERYRDRLHADARFSIQQLGLLGDQYVEITPQDNASPLLQPGQVLPAEEPFSIQETARSAKDLLRLASETLKSFNAAFARVERILLSEQVLTNATVSVAKFREISEKGSVMVDNIDRLITTNTPAISISVSNLSKFSMDIEQLASQLNMLLQTNRSDLNKAVKNFESMTRTLERLSADMEAGKGLAGLMLRDPQFRGSMSNLVANLERFSVSLNQRSLLKTLLFKPPPAEPQAQAQEPAPESEVLPDEVYPGRTPFK